MKTVYNSIDKLHKFLRQIVQKVRGFFQSVRKCDFSSTFIAFITLLVGKFGKIEMIQ